MFRWLRRIAPGVLLLRGQQPARSRRVPRSTPAEHPPEAEQAPPPAPVDSERRFLWLLIALATSIVLFLIALAAGAGMSLTHLAMAFAIAHPGVTAAIIGPRTMEHLDDLLAGAKTELSDELLDRIDAIVPPGTDVGTLDMAYQPPAIRQPGLRRRPADERAAD